MARVRTGLERVVERPGLLGDVGRVALLTNDRAVMPDLSAPAPALLSAGLPVSLLLTPEHGLTGSVQAGESEGDLPDPETGLPVVDTFGLDHGRLDDALRASGVDAVLFDLPDIGSRFYTYVWSLYDLMASAARTGVRTIVLDRPNPLSGAVAEGPTLDPAYASFVGRLPIPVRHGLTAGELARYARLTLGGELDVVPMEGWSRSAYADETGMPWVMPSVNIPTLDSALVYPGTCLFEGTNASEGRGTTRPFELIGAPYVDDRWRKAIQAAGLPGAAFRDVWFVPTFHKYAGTRVRGVQVHVVDRVAFEPVRTGVTMLLLLAELYPDAFAWTDSPVSADGGEQPFIDLLWGSGDLREAVGRGGSASEVCPPPASPARWLGERADACMLYA